jgi:hypothetical protein
MGLQWAWGIDHGETGVFVATVLIVLCADIVDVGESLVRVDGDEVGGAYARIGEVSPETSLEDGEDGVVRGINGR